MRFCALILLAGSSLFFGREAEGKPEGVVDGVNELAEKTEGAGGEAFSPAGAFFALLMLGELDDGETGRRARGVTSIQDWRGDAARAGGTEGWMVLGNTWWVDHFDKPSEDGKRVVERFRGKILPVDFWNEDDRKGKGVDQWVSQGGGRGLRGVLLTEASFRPQWKYAMREAGLGVFRCGDGDTVMREYIQSRVIPAKTWTGNGGIEFALELEGGGEAFFSTGRGRWEGKPVQTEAIVFVPKFAGDSTVDCGVQEAFGRVAGEGSTYGKLLGYGRAELSKWILRSKIDFREGGGTDWAGTEGAGARVRAPMVLRVEDPLFYRITGAHGEVVMQGLVGCGGGEKEEVEK